MRSILYEAAKASSEIIFEPGAKIERFNMFGYDSDRELSGIDLSDSEIIDSNFTEYDLRSIDFSDSKIENVDFTDVDLTGADFTDALLTSVDFEGADLTDTNFEDTSVKYCDFSGARFTNANLQNVRFVTCKFDNNTTFKGAKLIAFSDKTFRGDPNSGDPNLYKMNFDDAYFIDGNFNAKVDFTRTSLRNVKFINMKINGVEFHHCDLSGADFTTTGRIKYMYFNTTKLYGTKFKGLTMPKSDGRRYREAIEELESMYNITYYIDKERRRK